MFDSPRGTPKQGFKVYSACSRPEDAPKGPWPDVESASSLCTWTTSAVALGIDLLPRQRTKQKRCVCSEGQDALEFGILCDGIWDSNAIYFRPAHQLLPSQRPGVRKRSWLSGDLFPPIGHSKMTSSSEGLPLMPPTPEVWRE